MLVKKGGKKDICLMKNLLMVCVHPSAVEQRNQGYKGPDVEKTPRPHGTNGWTMLSEPFFFFFPF